MLGQGDTEWIEFESHSEAARSSVASENRHATAVSATWEQAFSFDNGATWDTNWVTRHTPIENEGRRNLLPAIDQQRAGA